MILKTRKDLCATGLIKILFQQFSKIPVPDKNNRKITIADCLMACFAVFNLKWPSLLKYEEEKKNLQTLANLRNLYHIQTPPSDTYMRERLDCIEPVAIRPAFKKILAVMQRGKALEQFKFLDGYYLVSIDGTGLFSSEKVHCSNCCVKHHYGNRNEYYHQMLGAVILHPDQKVVIPLCPEHIQKQDGSSKNDCERNASMRLLSHLRREHPHLKIMVVEDALSANAPHIRLLQSLSMSFLIVAKGVYDYLKRQELPTHEYLDESGTLFQFRFKNNIPLNGANDDVRVNYFECTETNAKGKRKFFSWITDITISHDNLYQLMRGGRSRWKIENETFNTLKNQGYHFEHNFGHGNKNLCTIMSYLMMLAFLIDQCQLLSCKLFQEAKQKARTFYTLWEDMRALFRYMNLNTWEQFLGYIAKTRLLNTS